MLDSNIELQIIQWRCRAESATALDQFGYRFVRRFICFVILTFVIFLCLCSRDLHVLFVLFSILPILFRFFPCDPGGVSLLFATLLR